jgi:CheY-like chemotaxis protein
MLVLSRKKNIGLEFVYEDGLNRFFTGDPERIRQIVVNLMSNAIKFTERGSVSLRVGRASDGMVMISVRDTGIGIPADRIEQIFEPFSQADGSITRRYGGTGLGTTIVRQLVSLMEGRIEVSSEVGQGSEFRVILPLRAGNEPLERARIEARDLRPLRILVADDAPVNIDLLVNVLGRAGHQLVTAENGQLAVDRYAEGVFDLVLMDIQMPVLTGLQATREIRKIENERGSPRVPIIALTADVDAELRFVAVDAGMDGFIMKPLDMALLKAEMTRLVGGAGSPAAALQPHKRVAEAAPPTAVPIARDSIDWSSGIERWGSEAALVRAICTFVVETKPLLVTLRNEPKPDGERVKQVMHRFRGASGNLSMPKIAAVARAAELEAAVIDADAYLAALATIASEVEIIDSLVAASATTRLPVEAPRGEIDEAAMAELVGRVAATLRNFEIDESLLVELSAVCDPRTFGAIQTALDSFDFEAALQALEVLQQPA